MPEVDRLLFATLIAAYQVARRPDFVASLGRRHKAMDAGRKWAHSYVLKLHEELETQGLCLYRPVYNEEALHQIFALRPSSFRCYARLLWPLNLAGGSLD